MLLLNRCAYVDSLGFGWNFGFTPDNKLAKVCRREFDPRFRQIASREYRPSEVAMAYEILRRFLDTPERFMYHLR